MLTVIYLRLTIVIYRGYLVIEMAVRTVANVLVPTDFLARTQYACDMRYTMVSPRTIIVMVWERIIIPKDHLTFPLSSSMVEAH